MHEGMLLGLHLGNYAVEVHKYVGPPPEVEYMETYNLEELGALQRAARHLQLHGSVTTYMPRRHLTWCVHGFMRFTKKQTCLQLR